MLEVDGVEDGAGVGVGEGEGVGDGVGEGLGTAELDDTGLADELEDTEPPLEPSTLNVTMLAVEPEGTVTTQKSAPPAPVAESALETTPTPLEGLIEHGRPLQPPPGHSILTPKVGGVLES